MVRAAARIAKGFPSSLTTINGRWYLISSRQPYTACVREKIQKKEIPVSAT